MRRLLLLLLALFVHACIVNAQQVEDPATIPGVAIYAVVQDSAARFLAHEWDSTNAYQHERGYCVTKYSQDRVPPEYGEGFNVLIRVSEVVRAHEDSSGPGWVTFTCPEGQPELHTHPPATCYGGTCVIGGPNAYEEWPSRPDLYDLIRRNADFGIIQTGPHDFRFYYPFEFRIIPKQFLPPAKVQPES